jgi:hypothetical protein
VAAIAMAPTLQGQQSPCGEAAQLHDMVAGYMTRLLISIVGVHRSLQEKNAFKFIHKNTLDVKRRFVLRKTKQLFYFSSLQYKEVGYDRDNPRPGLVDRLVM